MVRRGKGIHAVNQTHEVSVYTGTLSIEVQQILNAKMQKKGVDLQGNYDAL